MEDMLQAQRDAMNAQIGQPYKPGKTEAMLALGAAGGGAMLAHKAHHHHGDADAHGLADTGHGEQETPGPVVVGPHPMQDQVMAGKKYTSQKHTTTDMMLKCTTAILTYLR